MTSSTSRRCYILSSTTLSCERGSAILNLGLAVFRWRFGPLCEAFFGDLPPKKIQWREPRGGPPTIIHDDDDEYDPMLSSIIPIGAVMVGDYKFHSQMLGKEGYDSSGVLTVS